MGFFNINVLNLVLSFGGLILLLVTVGLWVDYFWCRSRYYQRFVEAFVWPLIMATTIGSVALSLVYSEYFGFVPCSLCWLQRIALYPQAILSVLAYRLKEQTYFPLYAIALSTFGLLVAIYHYFYQMLPSETFVGVLPCLTDGSANCADKVINNFGFVTFPFLSAVTFAFLMIIYLNVWRSAKNQANSSK